MKAAVLEGLNRMTLKEIPEPKVSAGMMLVRVQACAVCGSDLRIFHFGNERVKYPQVIGHEIAGEVVEVGENVRQFKVGDRVAIGADVPCGQCEFCQNGMGNNCPINFAIGYQFPGGFAQYILLNPMTVSFGPVTKIPEGLGFDEAALAEPLACAINGLELSNLKIGKTLCIIGAGPIGCMMIDLGRVMGASKVIVLQRSARRMALARQFGADIYISSESEDVERAVLDATDGFGPDVVVTACASVEAQEQAIRIVKKRGYVNLFGGLPKGARNLSIPSNIIHYKECFVHGSHGSVPRHHRIAVNLIASGAVRVKKVISATYPLSRIEDAFRAHEERKGLKVIIHPQEN